MSYNFLVVDDEEHSRNYIRDLINEFQPGSNISEAGSSEQAKKILEEGDTNILFLDIEMPDGNGFGLLNAVSRRDFELIFVTAYKDYAIEAINEGASAYLLKPIKKTEFKDALQKVIEKKKRILPGIKDESIIRQVHDYMSGKLLLNHQQGIKMVTLKDIIFLKASNSYTTIYLNSGEKITTSKAINKFEDKLDSTFFFRIHKTYIINIFHFKEYLSNEGDYALMSNGEKLHISRYRLSDFISFIKNISGDLSM